MSLENEENMNEYIAELNELKVKYKKDIKLLAGFELDIVDPFLKKVPVDFINKMIKQEGIDFVVAGYHFYGDGKGVYYVKATKEYLEEMVNNIEILLSQTKVRYIAHPSAFVEGNGKWEE